MLIEIKKQIIAALPRELGVRVEDLITPPDKKMGDLTLACFGLAKKMGKNPVEAAKEISSKIIATELVQKVEVAGPYINFFLDGGVLASLVLSEIKNKKNKFGLSNFGKEKRLMVEYSQPNTHKEFHVGHVRNATLGSALVNIYKAIGYKVIAANYIGDIGAHVAKCLWGLEKFHQGEKPPQNKGKWLGQIYTEASKYVEADPLLKNEVALMQQKLESGDKHALSVWKKTRQWSLESFDGIYKKLDIKFDYVFYESEVEKEGKKIVAELLTKGIAEKGEGGAIIVDLKKFGLDIFLILKSDGTSLYSTKDLALAKRKFEKYRIENSIYVVDTRQSFYFKQLFKVLELWGFHKPLTHVAYEFVKLPEGAMSSRLGRVVLFEDIFDEIIASAKEETKKRHIEWTEKKINEVAREIALGALKFSMIKVGPDQIITFDVKEAVSFEGFTAPYLQYSLVRMNSILKKSSKSNSKFDYSLLTTDWEKKLIFKMAGLNEVIQLSGERNDPSQLAKYLYELCQDFSIFYENCPILRADTISLSVTRLALVRAAKQVLENGLNILGIPLIKEM